MKYTRYCRSLLSTPALAVERYANSHKAGADICLADLEDSIPPWAKEDARRQAEEFFTAPTAAATRCAVRINSVTEPDGLRDLLAIQSYRTKPAVVIIPMVESPRDIEIVESVLAGSCPDLELFAIVETPRGVANIASIAAASPRLRALSFGAADYSFAAGMRLSWEALAHARAWVANSARAANVEVIDSPTFGVSDSAALRRDAALARDLGFSGKVAIHPDQVPIINEAFSPDASTLDKARRIVEAGKASNRKIAVVDGAMVGTPFFEASQRLIEEFGTPSDSLASSTARGES